MRGCRCDEVCLFIFFSFWGSADGVRNSSIASLHNATNVDMMSYATTKAATDHLVSLLAAKFARWYVRVVGINPGCKFPSPLLNLLVRINIREVS